jgi:hydroxymethylglutaryl-CoA synthase
MKHYFEIGACVMKIGIDQIAFYVPKYYFPLKDLAKHNGIDPNKYIIGLQQKNMSVAPFSQDVVSMGVNAALTIVNESNKHEIDMVLFATESGIDQSKSAATHIPQLLGLDPHVRAVELKQACYAGTAALYFAKGHILQKPNSKVLIITSDIARYGVNTDGEPTQGAGAVAMIVSKNPKILTINDDYGLYTDDIYDFFRPNKSDYALVNGHYSNEQYKRFFNEVYEDYLNKSGHKLEDFNAITFHIPYSKMGLRTLQLIASVEKNPELFKNHEYAIKYNQEVGNIYTGSLFLSLVSLLEFGKLKAGSLIGLYSYGSGAVAEFFSGKLVRGYKKHLHKAYHQTLLKNRTKLDHKTYETYLMHVPYNNEVFEDDGAPVHLSEISQFKRIYKGRD